MPDDGTLRDKLGKLLAGDLRTQWCERAYDSASVNTVTAGLRVIEPGDFGARLALAGFTDHPYAADGDDLAQACETCMYYAVKRQFCELPELMLPVLPDWSCRL